MTSRPHSNRSSAVGGHPAWATVASYAGFLALALAVTAIAATQAFRTYQRST